MYAALELLRFKFHLEMACLQLCTPNFRERRMAQSSSSHMQLLWNLA